jgi:hypothetical protein
VSDDFREEPDDLHNKVVHFVDSLKDRFSFDNPRFVERYLESKINVWVYFRSGRINKEYIAHFYRAPRILGRDVCVLSDSQSKSPGFISLQETRTSVLDVRGVFSDIEGVQRCGNWHEKPVLIPQIQLVELPEKFIPSLVGLEVFNNFASLSTDSLYFSIYRGLIGLGGIVDREPRLAAPDIGIAKSPNQIVESAPELMEDVTTEERKLKGSLSDFGHEIDQLLRLRIIIGSESVGVCVQEDVSLELELLDVFVGPLDLCLSAPDVI